MLKQQSNQCHVKLWMDSSDGCPLIQRSRKRGRPSKADLSVRTSDTIVSGVLTKCLRCKFPKAGSVKAVGRPAKAANNNSSYTSSIWVFEPDSSSCLTGSAHLVSLQGTRWQAVQDDAAAAAGTNTNNSGNLTKQASVLPASAGPSWLKAQQQGFAGECKDIVGHRIAVWWPDDKAYYEGYVTDYYYSCISDAGVICSSSPDSDSCGIAEQQTALPVEVGNKRKNNSVANAENLQGKHRVQYDDGDVELLDLRVETWSLTKYTLQQLKALQQQSNSSDSSISAGVHAASLPAAGHELCSFAASRPTYKLPTGPSLAAAAGGNSSDESDDDSEKQDQDVLNKDDKPPRSRSQCKAVGKTAAAAPAEGSTGSGGRRVRRRIGTAASGGSSAGSGGRGGTTAATAPAHAAKTTALKASSPSPAMTNNDNVVSSVLAAAAAAASKAAASTPAVAAPKAAAEAASPAVTAAAAPGKSMYGSMQQLLSKGLLAGLQSLVGTAPAGASNAAAGASSSRVAAALAPVSLQAATAAAVAAAMAANTGHKVTAAAASPVPSCTVAQGLTPAVRTSTSVASTKTAAAVAATTKLSSIATNASPPAKAAAAPAAAEGRILSTAPPTEPKVPSSTISTQPKAKSDPDSAAAVAAGEAAVIRPESAKVSSVQGPPVCTPATPANNAATNLPEQQLHHLETPDTALTSAVRPRSATAALNSTGLQGGNSSSSKNNSSKFKVPAPPGTAVHAVTTRAAAAGCEGRHANVLPPRPRKVQTPDHMATAQPVPAAARLEKRWQDVPVLAADVNIGNTGSKHIDAAAASAGGMSSSARQLLDELLAQLGSAAVVAAKDNHVEASEAAGRNSSSASVATNSCPGQLQAITATDNLQFSLLVPCRSDSTDRHSIRSSSSSTKSAATAAGTGKYVDSSSSNNSCLAVLLLRLPVGLQPHSVRVQSSGTALQISYTQTCSTTTSDSWPNVADTVDDTAVACQAEMTQSYRETVCLPGGVIWAAGGCKDNKATVGTTGSSDGSDDKTLHVEGGKNGSQGTEGTAVALLQVCSKQGKSRLMVLGKCCRV